jgi:hypothetical protein
VSFETVPKGKKAFKSFLVYTVALRTTATPHAYVTFVDIGKSPRYPPQPPTATATLIDSKPVDVDVDQLG